ncbi:hypothetical protein ATO6_04020 [Oceanicola sp. 22II-s10i]|nr:hypothetical protein ATO6_04020 [Oceanicola sp. 22II-s10i]
MAQQPGLHYAALTGDIPMLQGLLTAGADPDAQDAYGSTPLSVAVTFDKDAAVAALLAGGADPDAVEAQGSTPLHLAAFFGRRAAAEALIASGADIHLRNGEGSTAFDIAAQPAALDAVALATISGALAPLGFRAEAGDIDAARPGIAALLRADMAPPPDYTPAPGGMRRGTPDLPAGALDALFGDATHLPNLRALLVVQHGDLVAERYFNGAERDRPELIQSVSKSVISALVGLAIEDGCLSLDDTAASLLPEVSADPAKALITLRQFLQMRSGLPWEETDPALWQELLKGETLKMARDFPLVAQPGTAFHYSNLTANILALVTARQCGTDLMDMARDRIFDPVQGQLGEWWADPDGYRYPLLHMTARTAARFGLLYLNGGTWNGRHLIPAGWVAASLEPHTPEAKLRDNEEARIGRWFRDVGYGYQWWSARIGTREVDFAWGHGGQLIILDPQDDLILVTLADPFWNQHDAVSWRHERGVLNLAGKFIALLP